MKRLLLLPGLIAILGLTFAQAAEVKTIAYPTAEAASFVIEAPGSWEITPAEEEGDYFHLEGPTGATFSFRTIEGSQDTLEEAIKASLEDINEKFTDVEMGDAQDWTPANLEGFYATGQGKEKDGTVVRIGVAWCALKDGKIAELWFVSDIDDKEGIAEAEAIANSLTTPE